MQRNPWILTGVVLFVLLLWPAFHPSARAQEPFPLGTNLAPINDWSRDIPFLDPFKTSRPWISGTATTWSDGRAIDVDANGWVRSLLPGQVARTLLFWSEAPLYPAGRYVVEFEGEGALQYGGAARVVERSPGRDVLQVDDPTRSGISITLTATRPENPVRNLRVRMPVAAAPDEVFHPVLLDRIRSYRVIRFMMWTFGHSQQVQVARWADRPRVEMARWVERGVPAEVMCALANRVGADAWFCVPHVADDGYVRELARLIRRELRPDLRVYVEHSNEVWNSEYPQASYARERGRALGLSDNDYQAQIRYHAQRTREIGAIFAQEIPPARLIRVLGSFAVNPWTSEQMLAWGDVAGHVDAVAIGPYFSVPAGTTEQVARLAGQDLDALFGELESVALPRLRGFLDQQAAIAHRYGKTLIAYEAGQHLVAGRAFRDHAALRALFDGANRDPRMGRLYDRALADWGGAGGGLYCHFLHCEGMSRHGRFGSLEYPDQPRAEAPKYDALQRYLERTGQARAGLGGAPPAPPVAAALAPQAAADDLAPTGDEFRDPATLSSWERVHRLEGGGADPLERIFIQGGNPGSLTMIPYSSSWYRDYRGELTCKRIQGDFAATLRVRVTNRAGTGAPGSQFSLAGIMVRTPRDVTPETWTPGGENYVFLSLGAANVPGRYDWEVKTTRDGNSVLEISAADVSEAVLQAARIGAAVILLRRAPGGPWQVHRRYRRADFPATLQVGMTCYTDWPTVASVPPAVHNRTVLTGGNPDLVARYDYLRFRRPVVPADLAGRDLVDPAQVSDADLLRFLGEAVAGP